jgi:membrane protease YdiL (CAAX protease family)
MSAVPMTRDTRLALARELGIGTALAVAFVVWRQHFIVVVWCSAAAALYLASETICSSYRDALRFGGLVLPPLRAVRHLLVGVGIGMALVGAALGALAASDHLTLQSVSFARGGLAYTLVLLVGVAVAEELAVRGPFFMWATARWGAPRAITFSSVVFVALHLANAHRTWLGLLVIGVSGVLFCLIRLGSSLWAVIGVHLGWNLVQALAGLPVSGRLLSGAAFRPELHGSRWWTGAMFGVEGSLVLLGVLFIALNGCLLLMPPTTTAAQRGVSHAAASPSREAERASR